LYSQRSVNTEAIRAGPPTNSFIAFASLSMSPSNTTKQQAATATSVVSRDSANDVGADHLSQFPGCPQTTNPGMDDGYRPEIRSKATRVLASSCCAEIGRQECHLKCGIHASECVKVHAHHAACPAEMTMCREKKFVGARRTNIGCKSWLQYTEFARKHRKQLVQELELEEIIIRTKASFKKISMAQLDLEKDSD